MGDPENHVTAVAWDEQHPSPPRLEADTSVQVTVHTYIPYIPWS